MCGHGAGSEGFAATPQARGGRQEAEPGGNADPGVRPDNSLGVGRHLRVGLGQMGVCPVPRSAEKPARPAPGGPRVAGSDEGRPVGAPALRTKPPNSRNDAWDALTLKTNLRSNKI